MKIMVFLYLASVAYSVSTYAAESEVTPEDRAVQSWKEACASGGPQACEMAAYQANGNGFTFEAKRLYKKACDGGLMSSCRLYGVMQYEAGNSKLAMRYAKKACKGGSQEACLNVEVLTQQLRIERIEAKKRDGQ